MNPEQATSGDKVEDPRVALLQARLKEVEQAQEEASAMRRKLFILAVVVVIGLIVLMIRGAKESEQRAVREAVDDIRYNQGR